MSPNIAPARRSRSRTREGDTRELLQAASMAIERVWRNGYRYHKVGVILGEFTSDAVRQGELFTDEQLTAGRHPS